MKRLSDPYDKVAVGPVAQQRSHGPASLKFPLRSVHHLHYLSRSLRWQCVESVAPVCSVPMETDHYYLNKSMQKKTT